MLVTRGEVGKERNNLRYQIGLRAASGDYSISLRLVQSMPARKCITATAQLVLSAVVSTLVLSSFHSYGLSKEKVIRRVPPTCDSYEQAQLFLD